jgi:methyl-accepting chemotaxis protein
MNTADSSTLTNTPTLEHRKSQLFANLPMRAKLLLAFLAITALSAGLIAFFSVYTTSTILIPEIGAALKSEATQNGLAVGGVLDREVSLLQAFSLNKIVQDSVAAINAKYDLAPGGVQEQIQALDAEWVAAADADQLIQSYLTNGTASELQEYRSTFPDNVEVFVTDKLGGLVAATNRTSDYYQADEDWWQAAWNKGQGATYIGPPEFDESSKTVAINIAIPLYHHNSQQPIGILRSTYRLDTLIKTVDSARIGETGRTQLFLSADRFITLDKKIAAVSPEVAAQLTAAAAGYTEMVYSDVPSLVSQAPVMTFNNDPAINNLGWHVVIHQDSAESLAPLIATEQTIFVTSLGTLALSALLALVIAQLISAPIRQLTAAAGAIAAGDLSRRLGMRRRDEIGRLAQNFDSMAQALEDRIATEQAARAEAQRLQLVETDNRQLLEQAVGEYLEFVQQVALGDLSQHLTPRYDGALGKLGAGLNSMIASLRDITSQVQEGANAIAAAVAQISAATIEQAAASAQQSAAVTETATAIEEVKVIALQTADQAAQVAQGSKLALDVARQSDQTVIDTVGSMNQIHQQVGSIARTIHGLADQTESISTIITAISALADQISHLASNAAIESIRSDVQDRDIGALARLVHDLGNQAKDSTQQVRLIVSEIQSSTRVAVEVTDEGSRRVETGVRLVTETGTLICQIAAQVEGGAQANVQMAAAAQQQTLGMQQIAQAMAAIQQAMSQALEGTRQTEEAAQGLLTLSQSLQQAITVYRL